MSQEKRNEKNVYRVIIKNSRKLVGLQKSFSFTVYNHGDWRLITNQPQTDRLTLALVSYKVKYFKIVTMLNFYF